MYVCMYVGICVDYVGIDLFFFVFFGGGGRSWVDELLDFGFWR